jgi:hypothetical protein
VRLLRFESPWRNMKKPLRVGKICGCCATRGDSPTPSLASRSFLRRLPSARWRGRPKECHAHLSLPAPFGLLGRRLRCGFSAWRNARPASPCLAGGPKSSKEPGPSRQAGHSPLIARWARSLRFESSWRNMKKPFCKAEGLFHIWRPQGDSNPRRRRERAVSWARLDDRDLTLQAPSGKWPRVQSFYPKRETTASKKTSIQKSARIGLVISECSARF